MSLERGTYGIEYDGRRRNSGGKLWVLSVLIPLAAVILVLRGCIASRSDGVYSGDDTSIDDSTIPAVQVERERPSITAHFINAWRRKFRGEPLVGSEPSASDEIDSGTEESGADLMQESAASVKVAADVKIPVEVERLLKRSEELVQGGDFVSARMILEKLRLRPEAAAVRELIEKRIGEINITLILSDKPMPGKLLYKIKSGDLISRLARKYRNTEEYIIRVNGIEHPEKIRIGQELWVLDNPIFELMIDKSDFRAVLLFNHRFFKVYTVGLGAPGSVPAGTYTVRSRSTKVSSMRKELYRIMLRSADGTAEVTGFVLHGAENESRLGRVSQEGSVMFSPGAIEELYVLLPAGSTVTIVE